MRTVLLTFATIATATLLVLVPGLGHAAPASKVSAFVLTVVTGPNGNTCGDGSAIVFDNPLSNNNPNAVIVVTYNQGPANPPKVISLHGVLNVFYDNGNNAVNQCKKGSNLWVVNDQSGTAFRNGELLNIFVATP
jgi:hypothetical protein